MAQQHQTTQTAAAVRAAGAQSHNHAKGLIAALVTTVVLSVIALASDETFLVEYLGRDPAEYDPYETLPWISFEEALERMTPPPQGTGGKMSRGGGDEGDGDSFGEVNGAVDVDVIPGEASDGDANTGDATTGDDDGLILVHDLLIRVGEFRHTHSGGDVFGDGAFGDMTSDFEAGHSGGACGGDGKTYYMRTLAEYAVARVRRVNDTRFEYCEHLEEDAEEEEEEQEKEGTAVGAGAGGQEQESASGLDSSGDGDVGGDGRTLLARRLLSSPSRRR